MPKSFYVSIISRGAGVLPGAVHRIRSSRFDTFSAARDYLIAMLATTEVACIAEIIESNREPEIFTTKQA